MSDLSVEAPQSNPDVEKDSSKADFGKGWGKADEGKFSLGIEPPKSDGAALKPLEDLDKEEPKKESDNGLDAKAEEKSLGLIAELDAINDLPPVLPSEEKNKTLEESSIRPVAKAEEVKVPDKKVEAMQSNEVGSESWQTQTMTELLGVARQRAGDLTLPSETVDDLFKHKDGKDFSKDENRAVASFLEKYQKVSKDAPKK
jgi:hypothetical protein